MSDNEARAIRLIIYMAAIAIAPLAGFIIAAMLSD